MGNRRKRILIIEDSKDEREIYVKYLKIIAKDAEIIEAGNRIDAEQLLGKYNRTEEQFDLVLTDFHLPDGNSGEIVFTCNHNKVPVILMSKGSLHAKFDLAVEDADDFIEKPLDFSKLKTLIREMLGITR